MASRFIPSPPPRLVAIAMLTLLWPAGALAQAAGSSAQPIEEAATASSRSATAEALFQQGVALSESGQLREACAKFEASQALDVAVGTLLYLADCYERTGRLASAWARFREASSLAQAQAMPERARVAGVRAQALEPKLSHVEILVQAPEQQPRDLTITLDGTPVATASWGAPLPVDPGIITLRASAPGYSAYEQRIDLSRGSAAKVSVQVPLLARASQPTPAARGTGDQQSSLKRTLGIASTVTGAVGLATASVLAIVARNKNDDSLEHCGSDPNRCTPEGVELRNDAGRLADYATLSAALGGAFVVTGVVLLVTSPSRGERETGAVHLRPAFGPRGAALHAGGRF